ncbi:MAG: hypothetical protein HT580_04510 [Dechloromonas sp.]|nr:MAG: hypothetical protein HT580_04510 [Dechloromonas sp.]
MLRLPGHGTLPSMMVEMSHRDWTAAVRIAARDVASRVTPASPSTSAATPPAARWPCNTRSMPSTTPRCAARIACC